MEKIDKFALPVTADLAALWLKSIEKSSSTLTAAFYKSAYGTKPLRELVSSVESVLQLKPAHQDSLEKRLIALSDAAVERQIPLDDRWNEILPKLRAIADSQAAQHGNMWQAAKISRAILRAAKPD